MQMFFFIFLGYGDSGGPLMYMIDNRWYMFGITSTSLLKSGSCGEPTYFTKIPKFVNWIISNMELL